MAKRKAKPSPEAPAPSSRVSVTVECPVHDSFRVAQVAGMFDVPLAEKLSESFDVELPELGEQIDGKPWQIGVIVGPSGSGKSTIARHAFGEALYTGGESLGQWPGDKAVVDCFPEELSIRDVTQILTSVGFSSPPSWVKPYHVLSNGEKFRCDLARSLVAAEAPCDCGRARLPEAVHRAECSSHNAGRLVVFDEFTSVVDRTVAKIGSAAVSKHIRRVNAGDGPPLRFVAVACHYDIVEWLEPDWVLDMASRQLARGLLRRPRIELELYRCGRSAWELFRKAHYLSATIPAACKMYVGLVDGKPAALVVVASAMGAGHRDLRRISRLVVLPDFQGVGIGGQMLDAVAEVTRAEGLKVSIRTGHPSMIALLRRSKTWRVTDVAFGDTPRQGKWKRGGDHKRKTSRGRVVISARYIGGQNS